MKLGPLTHKNTNDNQKIDYLIEWCKRYPEIGIKKQDSSIFYRYASSSEEYDEILERYRIARSYYIYIRRKQGKGKLSKEKIGRCKEGNVQGIFGYPTQVESLAKYYGIEEKKIDYILRKYSSMDAFLNAYAQGKIDNETEDVLKDNLRHCIAIDSDTGTFSSIDDDFIFDVFTRNPKEHFGHKTQNNSYGNFVILSEKGLMYAVNNLDDTKLKYIIEQMYGLNGNVRKTNAQLARELGCSKTIITQYRRKALLAIRVNCKIQYENSISKDILNEKEDFEKRKFERIKQYAFKSKFVFVPDDEYKGRDIRSFNVSEILQYGFFDYKIFSLIKRKKELGEELDEIIGKESQAEILSRNIDLLLDGELDLN